MGNLVSVTCNVENCGLCTTCFGERSTDSGHGHGAQRYTNPAAHRYRLIKIDGDWYAEFNNMTGNEMMNFSIPMTHNHPDYGHLEMEYIRREHDGFKWKQRNESEVVAPKVRDGVWLYKGPHGSHPFILIYQL